MSEYHLPGIFQFVDVHICRGVISVYFYFCNCNFATWSNVLNFFQDSKAWVISGYGDRGIPYGTVTRRRVLNEDTESIRGPNQE